MEPVRYSLDTHIGAELILCTFIFEIWIWCREKSYNFFFNLQKLDFSGLFEILQKCYQIFVWNLFFRVAAIVLLAVKLAAVNKSSILGLSPKT